MFLRTSSFDLVLLFLFLNSKGKLSEGNSEFLKVEIWFLIFVTSEGLFGEGFSFIGFCSPWYAKHRSFAQDKELLDVITSLMRSFRASAAVILAPLGILPIRDNLDLHVIKCWSRSKSGVVWLSTIGGSRLGRVPFRQDKHLYLRSVPAWFFLIPTHDRW